MSRIFGETYVYNLMDSLIWYVKNMTCFMNSTCFEEVLYYVDESSAYFRFRSLGMLYTDTGWQPSVNNNTIA